MKKSPINERSQGMFSAVHDYLKGLTQVIRFGFQGEANGARHAYHACVSFTRMNCFSLTGQEYQIDPALFKISRGTLMGPENPKAERTSEGVMFTWKDNSWTSSAKPQDIAFLVIHNPKQKIAYCEEMGSTRSQEEHLLSYKFGNSGGEWHAYLAFSQENPRAKKLILSDSVYLGIV
ncbi:hypothetical protein J0A68_18790 [Algoriphagus sp. H41]|uniref:Uncharacterized protein n=2 Tax=Algoriphagus oliviformis TaxID=2811231 RepID=A0ABS3C8X8_9BACT|nr:hypothetical protein [Algoriphagus oliviformis]